MAGTPDREMRYAKRSQNIRGFTLIELMVSMVAALIVLAGMIGVFISESRTQSAEIGRTELMGDMQLAASIMKGELRQAQNVCWNGTNSQIIYQPLDSATPIPAACTILANSLNGKFALVSASAGGCSTSTTPCICWDRPNKADGCQELLRNMNETSGLSASVGGSGVFDITLTGVFQNVNRSASNAVLGFKVWSRN